MTKSAISDSEEYKSFRASVPLKRISIDSDNKVDWQHYCCPFLVLVFLFDNDALMKRRHLVITCWFIMMR
jgi:hypothetical protein